MGTGVRDINTYNVTILNGCVTSVSLLSHQYPRVPEPSSVVTGTQIIMGQEITMVEVCSADAAEAREDAIAAYELHKLRKIFS